MCVFTQTPACLKFVLKLSGQQKIQNNTYRLSSNDIIGNYGQQLFYKSKFEYYDLFIKYLLLVK